LATSTVLLDGCSDREAAVAVRQHAIGTAEAEESPIRIENRLPGDRGFALLKPASNGECEVYCSAVSVAAGDTVDVFVHTTQSQAVRLDLYRIGHYQGLGARLVSTLPRVTATAQLPYYSLDGSTGLVECNWSKTFSFDIDPSWVTGYYLIKVTSDDGFECHTPFIVRETGRVAPLLAQASVTTWQAYNVWGGTSLYANLTDKSVFAGPRGYQVSFDRPFPPHANVWREEFAMARWLEQRGYDVAYVSNVDLDRTPEVLRGRRLFASVGHDEYWSLAERNAVQDARDKGLSLAFFSGNAAYRRIRLETSSSGIERRVVTCYKSASLDPHNNAPDTTNDFSANPFARPESELIGLQWAGWSHLDGYPFVVSDPTHWVYEGTGVQANEAIGHVIGYEWDVAGRNKVTPAGLEIVGSSPALHEYGYISRAEASVYYPTPTSFVFASGTIAWSRALSEPEEIDPRLQRVTENILKRALVLPEASLVFPPVARARERASVDACHVLAGSGKAGHRDGPALHAQFDSPTGIATGSDGSLYVCDTGSDRIRKVSPDGEVTTIAGDQPGGARFHTPTGIAIDALGVVFVCDTNNDRIIAVTPDGRTVRVAGGGRGYSDNADAPQAKFTRPRGIAITAQGMFIADFGNDAIRRIDPAGVTTLVTDCGGPSAIAVAADGTLYFIATFDGSVVRVSPTGERTTLCNPSGDFGNRGGPGAHARLRAADGLVLTDTGLIVTDTGNNRVRFVAFDDDNTVSTLLGTGQPGDGVGADTELVFPRGAAAVSDGYVVTDCLNHRVLWFRM
jgi:sugar lactone lactonase YvrE